MKLMITLQIFKYKIEYSQGVGTVGGPYKKIRYQWHAQHIESGGRARPFLQFLRMEFDVRKI